MAIVHIVLLILIAAVTIVALRIAPRLLLAPRSSPLAVGGVRLIIFAVAGVSFYLVAARGAKSGTKAKARRGIWTAHGLLAICLLVVGGALGNMFGNYLSSLAWQDEEKPAAPESRAQSRPPQDGQKTSPAAEAATLAEKPAVAHAPAEPAMPEARTQRALLPDGARTSPLPETAPLARESAGARAPAESQELLTVTLFIPKSLRDPEIMVDGAPANIIDLQLSFIKLQVPRKAGPTHFEMRSSFAKEPKRFDLTILHDNYEYSPYR